MANTVLVIHAEGLKFSNVVDRLEEVGRSLPVRPVLAPVTPCAHQYHVYPFADRERKEIPPCFSKDSDVSAFAATLSRLSKWYDIGYHGHFHVQNGGPSLVPSTDAWKFAPQFNAEVGLLTKLGYRPRLYAGGWWVMTQQLASMLSMAGFEVDTTLWGPTGSATFGRDSLGNLQWGRELEFGRPAMLHRNVMEIQTRRTVGPILFQGPRSFYALSLHDYDLLDPSPKTVLRNRLLLSMASNSSAKTLDELLEKAMVVA